MDLPNYVIPIGGKKEKINYQGGNAKKKEKKKKGQKLATHFENPRPTPLKQIPATPHF